MDEHQGCADGKCYESSTDQPDIGRDSYIGEKTFYRTKKVQAWPEDKDGERGYGFECADGYISWSPENAFNEAYQSIDRLSFGHAIQAMKTGRKVCRSGWNGKGIFIELQVPCEKSKMTSPYIYINTTGLKTDNPNAPKSLVPWLASQTDMLANDWMILE